MKMSKMETATVRLADYSNANDAAAIAMLMVGYSSDPMGGGEALPAAHCASLAGKLSAFGKAFTLLALTANGNYVGIATCIESFSSFQGKPLVNVHDFYISRSFRGQGIAQALLKEVEAQAKLRNCGKLTLEVLDKNHQAKKVYANFGFMPYSLAEGAGEALFWQKPIDAS